MLHPMHASSPYVSAKGSDLWLLRVQDKRVTSFLAQWEGGSGGVLRKVSSLGQGVGSSLSKLLPRAPPKSPSRPAPAAAVADSPPASLQAAAQVLPGTCFAKPSAALIPDSASAFGANTW